MRSADHTANHPLDRLVLLVEKRGEFRRIAIDAERELRQIVAADRKAVETRRESPGQNDVRWYLAHHIDLKTALASPQAVFRHLREHAIRFFGGAAKGNHHDDVGEAQFVAQAANGAALQRETVAIARRGIARRTAKAEHWILFLRFELRPADQVRILVGLEVAHAHDDGIRMPHSRDPGKSSRQLIDEVLGAIRVARR